MSNRDPLYGNDLQRGSGSGVDPFGTPTSGDAGHDTGASGGSDTRAQDKVSDAASTAKAKGDEAMDDLSQKGQQAKEKAGDVADKVGSTADQGIDKSAEGLDSAAETLRQQGEQRGGAVGDVAATAADRLEGASGYLREKDTDQLIDDLEALVRRKPTESLLIAAGIGFVLSKVFR